MIAHAGGQRTEARRGFSATAVRKLRRAAFALLSLPLLIMVGLLVWLGIEEARVDSGEEDPWAGLVAAMTFSALVALLLLTLLAWRFGRPGAVALLVPSTLVAAAITLGVVTDIRESRFESPGEWAIMLGVELAVLPVPVAAVVLFLSSFQGDREDG